jgi:hypothetical protein
LLYIVLLKQRVANVYEQTIERQKTYHRGII